MSNIHTIITTFQLLRTVVLEPNFYCMIVYCIVQFTYTHSHNANVPKTMKMAFCQLHSAYLIIHNK